MRQALPIAEVCAIVARAADGLLVANARELALVVPGASKPFSGAVQQTPLTGTR